MYTIVAIDQRTHTETVAATATNYMDAVDAAELVLLAMPDALAGYASIEIRTPSGAVIF